MPILRNIATTSATLMLLVTGATAQAEAVRYVQLRCSAQPQQAMCDALRQALIEVWPSYQFSVADAEDAKAAVIIQYEEQSRADTWVSGLLTWSTPEGDTGTGPTIEQTVMDGMLTTDDLARFARALVQSTEIPL